MIRSMTGYAAASADSPRGTLAIELRSVNARFLDLSFRVGEELRAVLTEEQRARFEQLRRHMHGPGGPSRRRHAHPPPR